MSFLFPGEIIAETKVCRACGATFHITDADVAMLAKLSPKIGERTLALPAPTLCPDCRSRRRMAWRNERKLYKRTCDATGKQIVAMYVPETPFPVYHKDAWWSDIWDAEKFGRDFDFSRPFFEQFRQLRDAVPRPNANDVGSEDSEYQNNAGYNKSCYLTFDSGFDENCLYGVHVTYCSDCCDCLGCDRCSRCWKCFDCRGCDLVFRGSGCRDCRGCELVADCQDCRNCFGCVGLRHAEFHVFNRPVAETDYAATVAQLRGTEEAQETFEKLRLATPVRATHASGSENSAGDYLVGCKNARRSFVMESCENVTDCVGLSEAKDCADVLVFGYGVERAYECVQIGHQSNRLAFCASCQPSVSNLTYCDLCAASKDCFGCVGLRDKQYCVLNKQYTKAQYEALVPKIVAHMERSGEWGEFFPASISPFGYGETIAAEHFPTDKAGALAEGFAWQDYEAPAPRVEKVVPGARLPENVADVPDDVLNWAVRCEVSDRPFRIVKAELDFHRRYAIPLPRRHPDVRHAELAALRNPFKLWGRDCANCGEKMLTSYAPDRPETVWCEKCYDAKNA